MGPLVKKYVLEEIAKAGSAWLGVQTSVNKQMASRRWLAAYPQREFICLIVLPHVFHHQLHCVWVWGLAMEVYTHKGGHSREQTGNLLQLLPGVLHTIRPRMVHKENTAGTDTMEAYKESKQA